MTLVTADLSISLDGYVTGPRPSRAAPLGRGGERLHEWVHRLDSWRDPSAASGGGGGPDADVLAERAEGVGAVIMGGRMFAHGGAPWGEEPPFRVPVLVLDRTPREPLRRGRTLFRFVTGGPAEALAEARRHSGDGKIAVAGGALTVRRFLLAGLVDDLQLHLVPILLGGGTRLFDGPVPEGIRLEQTRVIGSPTVTHLRYLVRR
ncbi:dihydrofolate reductase family protein [Streptomyces calidiresistens]|uniref:Dihydrofolate reductase n=1 Tax=Streptomyces calidiresistens TaxID=1485586 RepID=A0A7W3T1Q7_9ACTN|nr:dihydrofolate reductase family protein [Streptomyces calidiresistens]MBB0229278.1 dihydrofolate reductase [Streptomyces calidiresistens]